MILSFNANGDIETLVPERIYQGSNNANTISIVAPFPTTTSMEIDFELPDSSKLEPKLLVNGKYFLTGLNIWSFLVTKDITKYFGNIKLQIKAMNLPNGVVNGTEIIVATGSTTFVVEQGIAPSIPDVPEQTTYLQIAQLLQDLSTTKIDRIDINNIPVGIEYNLNGYKTPNAFYYNPSIYGSSDYILVTSFETIGETEDYFDIAQQEWKFTNTIEWRNMILDGKTKEVKSIGDWTNVASSIVSGVKAELNIKITKNTNDINSLKTQVNTNTSNIETNTQDIEKNTQNVAKNTIDIQVNTQNISINTQDISKNTQDIEYLKQHLSSGENFVGEMNGSSLPTDEELNSFVEQIEGREQTNGDTIIFILEIPNETDRNYKYIYSVDGWSYYELPTIEPSSNGSLGSVKGTYNIGSANTTQLDISGGEVKRIYITDNSTNELQDVETFINSNKSAINTNTINIAKNTASINENANDIANNTTNININTTSIGNINDTIESIKNGNTTVGKSNISINDSFGNNIANTYQTKAEGATKNYVREYSLPRTFNDVYYVSASGYETTVPTEPLSGVQFTAIVNSINYTTLATIEKLETSEYELSRKNSYATYLYISSSRDVAGLNLLLTTYYQKLGEETKTTLDVETKVVSLTANTITRIDFEDFMTSMNNLVIDVGDGDKIIQVLEMQQAESTKTTYDLYSNEAYPSTFNLNTNAQVSKSPLGEVNFVQTIYNSSMISGDNLIIPLTEPLTNNCGYFFKLSNLPIDEFYENKKLVFSYNNNYFRLYLGGVNVTIKMLKELFSFAKTTTYFNAYFYCIYNNLTLLIVSPNNLATVDYVDSKIGQIDTLLDTINGEVV